MKKMNEILKKRIEEAAVEYAERIPQSDERREYSRGDFIAGSQWPINSVWQKPSAYGEELRRDIEVIAKTKRGFRFGKFDVVGCFHEYMAFVSTSGLEYALIDLLEYAYLSDLLPDGNI